MSASGDAGSALETSPTGMHVGAWSADALVAGCNHHSQPESGTHMLTVKRVIDSDTCLFCNKQKEVAAVQMDGQTEVLLCWNDVRKMAHMRMRMNGNPTPKAAAASAVAGQPVVAAK